MSDWKPRPTPGIKLSQLPLSMEQGFVFSRIDGHTRIADLGSLTGFTPEVVQAAIRQLLALGALQSEGAPPELLPAPPVAPDAAAPAEEQPTAEANASADAEPEPEPVDPESDEGPTDPGIDRGDIRALYAERFAALSASERAAEARQAQGDALSALCLDALPEVIRAVLGNPQVGPTQARLIAKHHHSVVGLGMLLGRSEFLLDGEVRRQLVRNPQLTEPLLTKLYAGRRLRDIFAAGTSREVTDQVRRASRNLLHLRFSSAAPQEKVELIWTTEGRVLAVLIGVALDGKSVQLFSDRVFVSALLVQNLARWPPTPAALLRHMLAQPLVMRSVALKNQVKRHPNAPKER